jgi:hypothetical protein
MTDEWGDALERFDERTTLRRARAKEHEEKALELIREAEERRARGELPTI